MTTIFHALIAYLIDLLRDARRGWNEFWFRPTDVATLAVIRICTGLSLLYLYGTMTADLLDFIGPTGYVDDAALAQLRGGGADGSNLPAWYAWSFWFWIRDPGKIALFHGYFLIAIACFSAGLFSRATSIVVWLGHLSYIARGFVLSYGVDAMLSMLLFCMVWGPTGGAYSLDRLLERYWRRKRGLTPEQPATVSWAANLSIRLIQIHLCLIYLCSGLSKLQGESWWNGTAVLQILMLDNIAPFDLSWVAGYSDRTLSIFSSAGVLFTLGYEIGFAFLVWNRRLRPLVLTSGLLLHIGIGLLMGLGPFSAAMATCLLAFIQPASMRWFFQALASRRQAAGVAVAAGH